MADYDGYSFPAGFFVEFLNAPESAELPLHLAASDTILNEYQNLSQDVRSAGEFIRATPLGWMSAE